MSYNNSLPIRQSTNTPLASAQSSVVTSGDLRFRYSSNAVGGNLEVQSSTATAVGIRAFGERYFPTMAGARNLAFTNGTAPAVNSAWATVAGGVLGADEMLIYEIFTTTTAYFVRLYLFNSANVHMVVEAGSV